MLVILSIALLAFDPAATMRALNFDEAREGTLVQLFQLDYLSLQKARTAEVGGAVARVVLDGRVPFRERVLGVRAVSHLQARGQAAVIAPLALVANTTEDVALAREVARALFGLGARHELLPALGAQDPEVRAYAARSGAGGEALCGPLLSDPWPFVRAAAAEGLGLDQEGAGCLLKGLEDTDQDVRQATARSLGEARLEKAVPALESLVRRAKTPIELRVDALYALGQIGALKGPRTILTHHLKHGGLDRLAHAAVAALLVSGSDFALLIEAVSSKSPRVALAAARGLVEQKNPQARELVESLKSRLTGPAKVDAASLLERFESKTILGVGTGTDAPEDSDDLVDESK